MNGFEKFLQEHGVEQDAYKAMNYDEQKSLWYTYFNVVRSATANKMKEEEALQKADLDTEQAKVKKMSAKERKELDAFAEDRRTDILKEANAIGEEFAAKEDTFITKERFASLVNEAKLEVDNNGAYRNKDIKTTEKYWLYIREKLGLKGNAQSEPEEHEAANTDKRVMYIPNISADPKPEDYEAVFSQDAFKEDRKYSKEAEIRKGTIDATDHLSEMFRLNERMKRNTSGTEPVKDMCKKLDRLKKAVAEGKIDPKNMNVGDLQDLMGSVMISADRYLNDKKTQKSFSGTQIERLECIHQLKTMERMLHDSPPTNPLKPEGQARMLATKLSYTALLGKNPKALANAAEIARISQDLRKDAVFKAYVRTKGPEISLPLQSTGLTALKDYSSFAKAAEKDPNVIKGSEPVIFSSKEPFKNAKNVDFVMQEMFRLNDRMKRNTRMSGPMKELCGKIDQIQKGYEAGPDVYRKMPAGEISRMFADVMESADRYVDHKRTKTSFSPTQLERLGCINQLKTLQESLEWASKENVFAYGVTDSFNYNSSVPYLKYALAEKLIVASLAQSKNISLLCDHKAINNRIRELTENAKTHFNELCYEEVSRVKAEEAKKGNNAAKEVPKEAPKEVPKEAPKEAPKEDEKKLPEQIAYENLMNLSGKSLLKSYQNFESKQIKAAAKQIRK